MDEVICRGNYPAALVASSYKILVAKTLLARSKSTKSLRQNPVTQFCNEIYLSSLSATTFTRGLPDGPSSTVSGV